MPIVNIGRRGHVVLFGTDCDLSALEAGKEPLFEPDFDPDLLKKYAVSYMYGDDSYGDIDDILLRETANLLVRAGMCDDQRLGVEWLKSLLSEDYTAEDAAILGNLVGSMLLEDPSLNPLYLDDIQRTINFNNLFLQASQLDQFRQQIFMFRLALDPASLDRLGSEIGNMPDEIIGISVAHIKQAFAEFFQHMSRLAEIRPDIDKIEQWWMQKAQEAERLQGISTGILLTPAVMLFEPLDIGLSILQGDPLGVALSLLPGYWGWVDEATDTFRYTDDVWEVVEADIEALKRIDLDALGDVFGGGRNLRQIGTQGVEPWWVTRSRIALGIEDIRISNFEDINDRGFARGTKGRQANCVYCAWALDETLAGRPSVADIRLKGTYDWETNSVYGGKIEGFVSTRAQAIDEIERRMLDAGPGSRALVTGREHMWNVINDNGTVRFIDAQRNIEGRDIFPRYAFDRLLSREEEWGFLRTDVLTFDPFQGNSKPRGAIYR